MKLWISKNMVWISVMKFFGSVSWINIVITCSLYWVINNIGLGLWHF